MCTTMKELSTIAEKLYELESKKAEKKQEIDELETQIKYLKQETASYMKKRQKNKLSVDFFTILFTPFEKPSFDSKAFIANEENGQELYDKYKKMIPIERVTVKLAKA